MLKYDDMEKLAKALKAFPEVAAAYLFGSAAASESVVNDLDLLVLLYSDVNKATCYFGLIGHISEALALPEDRIDLLFFDLEEADPDILYHAVNEGILIKNQDPSLLVEKIEALSTYLMDSEFIIKRAKHLQCEQLEAFCAG